MSTKVTWRQAVGAIALGILLFFWSDFLHSFLRLEEFSAEPVEVVSVNDMGSVYWSSLKSDTRLVEGYFHFRPEVGQTYEMLTADNAVYYDAVDRLVFVEGRLNGNGGILVLNISTRQGISNLNIAITVLGWATLAFGIINLNIIKRRNKHVS